MQPLVGRIETPCTGPRRRPPEGDPRRLGPRTQPAWYASATIDKALAPAPTAATTETLMTEAFVAYASDVSTGRVRANRVDKDIDIQQRKVERADLLKAAAEATDFAAWLDALPPKGDYPALQKALAAWREQRATATFTPLPDGDRTQARHDRRARAGAAQAAGRARPHGARAGRASPISTTNRWPRVVKGYQETKGLTVDGVIGNKTTLSLNTTIDERIEQIVANLERRRWLPEDLGKRYVMVNAGDYSMVFVDGGKPVFQSLVIVGTPKDPTPEIQSVMRGFQTNPYWTVPPSIAGEEYLPMLRRDPNALAAGGFRLFESWSEDDELDPSGRLEQHPAQGIPLPHPAGAGRRQCAGLYLLSVRQQLRDLHARYGEPLAVHRGQPQFQPWLHPPAKSARFRRKGVRRPQRLQQGAGARGDR